MTVEMTERVADLTFKARALAQAHPLSAVAHRYRQRVVAVEKENQPLPEFAEWAATAFLVGYCIRRVEEADVDAMPSSTVLDSVPEGDLDNNHLNLLGDTAGQLANDLRTGTTESFKLLEPDLVEALLDKVISTEIDKRSEHWKANISASDWADFEQYVAWWVIHGYALRAAETVGSTT